MARAVKHPNQKAGEYSLRRTGSIFVVALALGLLLVFQVINPIRARVAKRYVERGDTYLVNLDFSDAKAEYQTALAYAPGNMAAESQLKLANQAETDIAAAADFYRAHGVQSVLSKLQTAQQNFTAPDQALKVGAQFYQEGEYVYAQYPLRKAVALDPSYSEAWNYLGLDYSELAKLNPDYQAKAKVAFAARDGLTTKYLTP